MLNIGFWRNAFSANLSLNSILDFATEKEIFLLLGAQKIVAHCYYYDETCRIEAFYQGRTLQAAELFEPQNLRKIAKELYRFHQLRPTCLPNKPFFELLHNKWGPLAIEPIQKIRFIPYAQQRFAKFLRAYEQRFGEA